MKRDPTHPPPSLVHPRTGGRWAGALGPGLGKLPMLALALVWCLGLVLPPAGPGAASGRSFQFVYHKPLTTLPASALDRSGAAVGRARVGVSGVTTSAGASPDSDGIDGSLSTWALALIRSPAELITARCGVLIAWPDVPALGNRCDLRTAGRAPPRA